MTTRALFALLALPLLAACDDSGNACDDYVQYVCDCDDQSACDDATNTYADADSKLQDECQDALEDAEAADEEAGEDCAAYGDTGATEG